MKTKMKATLKNKIKPDYYLSFLKKENDLNKILKAQKRDPSKMRILFTSPWDDYSTDLVSELKEVEKKSSKKFPLYIVDSYNMPHSFVIYKTTKVPQLVRLDRAKVSVENYLPRIYELLGVE